MLWCEKPEVQERDAFARRGQQRTFDRVAQRPKSPGVAGDHHLAQRVEQHEAVGAVEPAGHVSHHLHQRRPAVARQLAADLVHDDFGVGVARQVVVVVGQQLVAELGVVGQLAVEAEAEPLVLLQVVPLERLGVVEVVLPAGGVANVADRRPAGVALHDALGLAAMAQAKHLADGAQAAIRFEQLLPVGADSWSCRPKAGRGSARPAASAGSSRETWSGPCAGHSGLTAVAGKVIDGGQAALVMKFAHELIERPAARQEMAHAHYGHRAFTLILGRTNNPLNRRVNSR